jgi:hypothetical protein
MWHMVHKDGAPIPQLSVGLMGMHYAPGHLLRVSSTTADMVSDLVMLDRVSYDFGTWSVDCEGVDWSALGIDPLIFQADLSTDTENIWDSDKVFT